MLVMLIMLVEKPRTNFNIVELTKPTKLIKLT
jgi:hypothetical protein